MSTTSDREQSIEITINGTRLSVTAGRSVILALWKASYPFYKGASCLEGVCGSCRIMVRYAANPEVKMVLACQTDVEAGMQIVFPQFPDEIPHHYTLQQSSDPQTTQTQFIEAFPQSSRCRHCHGCTVACPKGIDVEEGVQLANEGRFDEAGERFMRCVMCDLCTTSCPEQIAPNYVALFARRNTAINQPLPKNLATRLQALQRGELKIEDDDE